MSFHSEDQDWKPDMGDQPDMIQSSGTHDSSLIVPSDSVEKNDWERKAIQQDQSVWHFFSEQVTSEPTDPKSSNHTRHTWLCQQHPSYQDTGHDTWHDICIILYPPRQVPLPHSFVAALGSRPNVSSASTEAPEVIRSSTTETWPFSAAQCSGVWPRRATRLARLRADSEVEQVGRRLHFCQILVKVA